MSEKRMVYAEDVIQRIRDLAPEILGGWYNPDMENELEQLVCVVENTPTAAADDAKLVLRGGWRMKIILYGDPRTKKNSARILKAHANRRIVAPSEAFMQYQEKCLWQIKRPYNPITARVNVRCVYYMATRRKVDLANLIEATCDILVKAKVLADDNSQIVAAHDGSRVDYDKKNPRAEIWIEEMEVDT